MRIGNTQNLLIDADDTLWENNIYYERVIHEVLTLLDRAGADSRGFRVVLDEAERRRIPLQGYGTVNFTNSLVETFQAFLPPHSDPMLPAGVRELSLAILAHPLEVIASVPETLEYLSNRHKLFMVTKGDPEEQSRKILSSNLQGFFQGIEILPEKDTQAYTALLERHGWEKSLTWMIGNSPRSDINPALAAGICAVYIPHMHTWNFEHENAGEHPRLIRLERFLDLRYYF